MSERTSDQAPTGVQGLDDVLGGGLARGHLYLLEGSPGTGKTTIALQFLLDGAERGETGLYITMSETSDELRLTAKAHGWSIPDTVEVFELTPPETVLDPSQQQTLLYSSDLELGETTRRIFEQVERLKPDRIVVDSLSEIRLLSQSSLRYRRQVLALKHYFARLDTTVLMLDDLTSEQTDRTVHSVAHGVVRLEELAPAYGAERRRLRVIKYRARRFRGGFHDFAIRTGGVIVFPRLVALEHRSRYTLERFSSDLPELDSLLGGGVEAGSSMLLLGPAGAGKSVFTLHYAMAALRRGDSAAIFLFDEEMQMYLLRTKGMGFDLEPYLASGHLLLQQVDAAELAPGEFAHRVRSVVSENDARTVIIDSLNGYQAAMPEENALLLHIHELLQYLNRQGVSTFLTVAQHGLVGSMTAPVDLTYLADSVILLRYFEAFGEVRRAVSVIKKRGGLHESTVREYRITASGLQIGAPLTDFQGVLTGVPTYVGAATDMLGDDAA